VTAEAGGLAARLVGEQFGVESGELTVGGQRVSALAERHGTPLFVYDAALLRRQARALRAALPDCVDLYYSVKANPHVDVVRTFVDEGLGLEIASVGEFERAMQAGGAPERTLFAGPGKRRAELERVVAAGIGEIHVESFDEIALLAEVARETGRRQPVAVRVNPLAEGSGGAMRMGGQPAAFGIDEERLEEAFLAVRAHESLDLRGVHQFAGTQVLDAGILLTQWSHAVDLARKAAKLLGGPCESVDLGGGLGIPYFAPDRPLDLAQVAEGARELFGAAQGDPLLKGTRFVLEPGRFLAGPAGLYLARVLTVKESRGQVFVVLDGGMNHHLAASGNLGQVIKRDYPIVNASRMERTPAAEPMAVVGPLCTPLDTLGRKVVLPRPEPGDLVAVLQSGAYGLTASPVGFLSHGPAGEVVVDAGGAGSSPPPVTGK
jgi:diaminopimelate decarboxylase